MNRLKSFHACAGEGCSRCKIDRAYEAARGALDRLAAAPRPPEAAREGEPTYPCAECRKPRTKAEGGTTFTVCDECWDKRYRAVPAKKEA